MSVTVLAPLMPMSSASSPWTHSQPRPRRLWAPLGRRAPHLIWPCAYLAAIALAETVTVLRSPLAGVALHLALMAALVVHGSTHLAAPGDSAGDAIAKRAARP